MRHSPPVKWWLALLSQSASIVVVLTSSRMPSWIREPTIAFSPLLWPANWESRSRTRTRMCFPGRKTPRSLHILKPQRLTSGILPRIGRTLSSCTLAFARPSNTSASAFWVRTDSFRALPSHSIIAIGTLTLRLRLKAEPFRGAPSAHPRFRSSRACQAIQPLAFALHLL